MARTYTGLVGMLALCVSSHALAQAQIYVCKDAAGKTITSDRPIPECYGRASKQLDRHGLVRREVAAPLTPEERREMETKQEQRKAELKAIEEQRNADRALLARFQKESDIELSRNRALASAESQIVREQATLTETQNQLKAAQADVDRYKAKPAPTSAQVRLVAAQQAVKEQQTVLGERQADAAKINAKYDDTVKRFKELTGR